MTVCKSNLQIMTRNILDSAVVTATSEQADYPADNLQFEQLSSKWRSVDGDPQVLTVEWDSVDIVSGFSLNGHNLGQGATIQIDLFQKLPEAPVSVTDIGGGEYRVSFSSNHLIPEFSTHPYLVSLTIDVNPTIVTPVVRWEDATNVVISSTGAGVGAGDGFGLNTVYTDTVDAVLQVYGWGDQPWGRGGWYGYDEKANRDYLTLFFPDILCDYARITITDPDNVIGYIEAGRMWLANSFTPSFNMSWGVAIDYRSDTKVTRTRSGSIISDNKPSYRTLNFSLDYLNEDEAMEVLQMFNYPSNKSDTLIALYPDDNNVLEQETIVLGRIVGHSGVGRQKTGYSASFNFAEGL